MERTRIDRAAEILTELINVDSPSGEEWEFISLLADILADIGYTPRIERGHGVANVVVNPKADIFFDAHMDVVRPWFPARKEGLRLYGRGASDDKGSIASTLLAMEEKSIDNVGFVFTADEEEGGRGAELFVDKHRPKAVFVMEPTYARLYDGQAGDVDFTAKFYGRDAHAAHMEMMDNPIMKAIAAVNEITSAEFLKTKEKYRIKPGMNVIKLVGDGKGYRSPEAAELSVTIRLDPSQDVQAVKQEVESILKKYGAEYEFDDPSQGFVVSPKSEVFQLAVEAAKSVEIDVGGTIWGWTHMHTYRRAGIESILIGPGSGDRTHTMEEYVELPNVIKVADFIKKVDELTQA